eukprot:764315-Hanusia_phi.AAC.2
MQVKREEEEDESGRIATMRFKLRSCVGRQRVLWKQRHGLYDPILLEVKPCSMPHESQQLHRRSERRSCQDYLLTVSTTKEMLFRKSCSDHTCSGRREGEIV